MIFADYKDWHRADDCIVVAPGPWFLANADWLERWLRDYWTIACNRALLHTRADYLLCMEPSRDSIWLELDTRGVSALFTHRPTGAMRGARKRPCPARSVNVDSKDVRSYLDPDGYAAAPATRLNLNQSTFHAIAVAAHMGFRNIGVMGMDMTPDRFAPHMDIIEGAYTKLRGIIERRRQRVYTLSPTELESLQCREPHEMKGRDAITVKGRA